MTLSDHVHEADVAMTLDRAVHGEWVIVTVGGELDLATVPELRAALDPATLPGGRTRVALDVSGLTFCDSSGIGVLVGAYKNMKAIGGQLVLVRVPECLGRRLRITGLDRLIRMEQTVDGL